MTLGCCLNAPGGGGGLGGVRVNGDLFFFLSASLVVVECFFLLIMDITVEERLAGEIRGCFMSFLLKFNFQLRIE